MTCLFYFTLYCYDKDTDSKQLGRKGFILPSQLAVHQEGKSEQEVGQESGGGDQRKDHEYC